MTSASHRDLQRAYRARRPAIKARLAEFAALRNASDERLFAELAFCICTPQSSGKRCWEAIEMLQERNLLLSGTAPAIARILRQRVRFHHTKARHIARARQLFFAKDGIGTLRAFPDPAAQRMWLVAHVKGIGFKEASHFLRNTGHAADHAILDRHILRQLVRYRAIREMPRSLTPRRYVEIEAALLAFARRHRIPASHLDLLFWSDGTGEIFK